MIILLKNLQKILITKYIQVYYYLMKLYKLKKNIKNKIIIYFIIFDLFFFKYIFIILIFYSDKFFFKDLNI